MVQGVGFRPAICRLAQSLGLAGSVRNDGGEVRIALEGSPALLRRFLDELPRNLPANARVDDIVAHAALPRRERGFRIVASGTSAARTLSIPPDLAPCDACLRELADPADRRFGYPFINCTACGPRFTIVEALPYDRHRTTMAAFPLCKRCRREYGDPADRRFHAEPNACPACGPGVALVGRGCELERGSRAITRAGRLLGEGGIVALKGVGGYALVVDARDEAAVARLRQRKRRPHKPLAVMARSLAVAQRLVHLDEASRRVLESPARPIVIAPRVRGSALAESVAPGLEDVGVMLPPSPLQRLLADAAPPLLVMTSGNRSSEPIAIDDRDAVCRLGEIADAFLVHDRAIRSRADDSVVRAHGGAVVPVRRARGYVPLAVELPVDGPPVLAVGGQQAAVVCLASRGRALPSQHIGDLAHPETYDFFERVIDELVRLVGEAPIAVAHDLHPDYRSTRWAEASGLPAVAVQHHHAHVASCLVDNGLAGPVIGVAFDGTGYGPDGTLWGGEFLEVELDGFRRLGHLRRLRLAGGEAAIRQPWRVAVAALVDAGEPLDRVPGADAARVRAVRGLIERPRRPMLSSGAGRWFDVAAALCGLRTEISYDGQAAAELEAIAGAAPADPYPIDVAAAAQGFEIDLRPAVRALAADLRGGRATPSEVAARFHETMAGAILAGCRRARRGGSPARAALSGGCFQNRRLATRARALLEADGFEVLTHRSLPPNDGGLSVGQVAVATRLLDTARRKPREEGGHVPGNSR